MSLQANYWKHDLPDEHDLLGYFRRPLAFSIALERYKDCGTSGSG